MKDDIGALLTRASLAVAATVAVAVPVIDMVGGTGALPSWISVPNLTLLVLGTAMVPLLLELHRLRKLDTVDERLARMERLQRERFCGLVRVHSHFPEREFTAYAEGSRTEITILQTWIPDLHRLTKSLRIAVADRGVPLRILLLHPDSEVVQLRDRALRRDPAVHANVKLSVQESLGLLAELHGELPESSRHLLEVRLFESLPSVAIYRADEHYLVSSFLHGRRAVDSTQDEIDGDDTVMGEQARREFDLLWGNSHPVRFPDWRASIAPINP
ncbi:hypothetical protein ACGFX4_12625 [Kitasatospora sp. NPDC048365]|uniref:hypothetical protein n=1 Tax=Kitasatospora sp. NPDC048365 TaxID=3364050 RepID=UPI003724BADB